MLYIMRHGKTDWNEQRKLQGQTDVPLNEEGREMALAAGREYAGIHLDVCYCSPLVRAKETAELFFKERKENIPVIIFDHRLKEMGFGVYEGVAESFGILDCPVNVLFYHPEEYLVPVEGGESLDELFSRTGEFLEEMVLPKVLGNSKLKSAAAANDQKVYVEGIFPGILEKIVVDAYLENDKAFDLLLKDKEKYAAFMKALANLSYEEFHRPANRRKWGAIIEADVQSNLRYTEFLPLYSLKAACGVMGDGSSVEPEGWVKAKGIGRLDDTMAVVRAVGDSMEPKIHDGDLCVVRKLGAVDYNHRIVLVQRNDKSVDPASGGAYLLKEYVKKGNAVVLRSLNNKYADIPIADDGDVTVVAYLHKILC